MIIIGTTRKPTQRIRSFVKELTRVIPNSSRLTRGKSGFTDFCTEARSLGASLIILVGSYHGNPGRLGFLRIEEEEWVFKPPTILLKSVQLLRETHHTPPASVRRLYVMPSTERDFPWAKKLAEVLDTTLLVQNHSPAETTRTAVLEVDIYQKSTLAFLSSDKTRHVGPSMRVKKFLNKGMGDMKRW